MTTQRIIDSLQNKPDNYIFPFFWQHNEDDGKLIEEIHAIYNSGIKALCVESRDYVGFGTDCWWHTMTVILEECKKLDMKVKTPKIAFNKTTQSIIKVTVIGSFVLYDTKAERIAEIISTINITSLNCSNIFNKIPFFLASFNLLYPFLFNLTLASSEVSPSLLDSTFFKVSLILNL